MVYFWEPTLKGHGIPEAMEAVLVGRSRMRLRVAILKPLATALAIGTGGPFGAEGPIIQTGAAFGSLFGAGHRVIALLPAGFARFGSSSRNGSHLFGSAGGNSGRHRTFAI